MSKKSVSKKSKKKTKNEISEARKAFKEKVSENKQMRHLVRRMREAKMKLSKKDPIEKAQRKCFRDSIQELKSQLRKDS